MSPVEAASVVYCVEFDRARGHHIRKLLRALGCEVVTFRGVPEVAAAGRPQSPCCLVIEVKSVEDADLRFHDLLADAGVAMPVILIAAEADALSGVRAIKSGATDFIIEPVQRGQLLAAVTEALEADRAALEAVARLDELKSLVGTLTPREREILAAVSCGMPNKHVAIELGIAEKTVKIHRARVMEKLLAESLADLVRISDLLGIRHPRALEGGVAVAYPAGSAAMLRAHV